MYLRMNVRSISYSNLNGIMDSTRDINKSCDQGTKSPSVKFSLGSTSSMEFLAELNTQRNSGSKARGSKTGISED